MGYVEVEQFALADATHADEFRRRDAALQTWCYANRPGLVRRTTARAEDGGVLVVTLFHGEAAPAPLRFGEGADALVAEFARSVDPSTYRRAVYRDLD